MSDIFINHAREDSAIADRIKSSLEALGLTVWSSAHDLNPDADIVTAIQRAIEDVGCVLTIWTPASILANWVRAEAQLGLQKQKLISACLGVPPGRLPPPFDTVQAIPLVPGDSASIDALAERVREFVRSHRTTPAASPQRRPSGADTDGFAREPAATSSKVFISYASPDQDVALELTDYLERAGHPCWIAPRDIDPGEDYRTSILGAIKQARSLVLLYSLHANLSFDVANELLLARKRGKRRLFLKTDDSTPDGPLEYELATVQWIDCQKPARTAGFERLARYLRYGTGAAGAARAILSGISQTVLSWIPYRRAAAAALAVLALLGIAMLVAMPWIDRAENISVIRIDPFTVSPDTGDMASLRGSIERKIVEYLDKNHIAVSSDNAAAAPQSSHRAVLKGRLTASPDNETVSVEADYLVGGKNAGSVAIQGRAAVMRDIYPSIPDAIFYGLGLIADRTLKKDKSARITGSPYAFALFSDARRRAAAHELAPAAALLRMAIEADPRFATAHWALADILAHQGDDAAALHRQTAQRINPDHPRISLLPGPTDPLPLLRERLRKSDWLTVEPGFQFKQLDAAEYDLQVLFWRIGLANFQLRIAKAGDVQGNTAVQLRDAHGAVAAFSGGFFEKDSAGRLSPSGLLIIDGHRLSKHSADPRLSGILAVTPNGVRLTPASPDAENAGYLFALQSGPRLIESDGSLGIHKNDLNRLDRTAVCLRGDDAIFAVTKGSGLSLFELASILMEQTGHGGPGCAVALNLDGGPSSQASVKIASHAVDVPGGWNIDHGVFVVRRKR